MKKVTYKFPPMDHQKKAMGLAWPFHEFAFFMDMGTGKTYSAIHLAAARYVNDQINAMLIFCPTPIKLVWENEWEQYAPCEYEVFVMGSGKNADAHKFIRKGTDKLKVMVFGIEAMSQGEAYKVAESFAKNHECMTVVDESSRIKNAKAARTKRIVGVGEHSMFRLIMTGTPITQGIEDLYAQFQFLNPYIIGLKSYFQFRNMYCQMGGFENRKIIGYQNTNTLLKKVSPYVYSVKIEDCIDMPERSYRRLIVDPTTEQRRAMQSLKDLFEAEVGGDLLITSTVLERLTRYQQIVGGNFPFNLDDGGYDTKPIPGPNPKIEALIDDIEDNLGTRKAVIWARFVPEIDLICERLREKYGVDSVVEFHGGIDYDGRKISVSRFQTDDNVRFFVSNPQTGGMGQTLTAAYHTYYYSNDFSYENRGQTERRTWRKGQVNHCTYTDIIMNVTYDKMIYAAISKKMDMAKYVEEQIEHHQLARSQ
jgi:SNF2 family DNA or RNA helicase